MGFCRALGGVFQWQRDFSLLGRGGFEGSYCSARGSILCATPTVLSGEPGHLPLPTEGDLQGPGVSHPCSSPPPSSLAAPSWPYLPGMVAPAPPAASWSNRWGPHGPYLWTSHGQGSLPPLSVGQLLSWGRGEPAHPRCAGARAGGIAWPYADHCRGMLEVPGTPLWRCRIWKVPAGAVALCGCGWWQDVWKWMVQ